MEPRRRLILTPEHVPVSLFPAGLGSRFLALAVDFLVVLTGSAAISLALGSLPFGVGPLLVVTLTFALKLGYHLWFEVRRDGRTPGKAMLGLRVVDARGLPVTFEQSLVRNVVRVLDFAPAFYGLGALACLLDRDRRRLGDLAASTLVVRERRRRSYEPRLVRAGAGIALDADARRRARQRIGLEEKELLLDLWIRAESLDDAARHDLMERLAARYRQLLRIDDPHLSAENLVREVTVAVAAPHGG